MAESQWPVGARVPIGPGHVRRGRGLAGFETLGGDLGETTQQQMQQSEGRKRRGAERESVCVRKEEEEVNVTRRWAREGEGGDRGAFVAFVAFVGTFVGRVGRVTESREEKKEATPNDGGRRDRGRWGKKPGPPQQRHTVAQQKTLQVPPQVQGFFFPFAFALQASAPPPSGTIMGTMDALDDWRQGYSVLVAGQSCRSGRGAANHRRFCKFSVSFSR